MSAAEAVQIVIFRYSQNVKSARLVSGFQSGDYGFLKKLAILTRQILNFYKKVSFHLFSIVRAHSKLTTKPEIMRWEVTGRAGGRDLSIAMISLDLKCPLLRTRHLGFSQILQSLATDKKILSAQY